MTEQSNQKSKWRFYSKHKNLKEFLIISILFVAVILFMEYMEPYGDKPALGTYAKKYVVSQVDFEFPDEDETAILKQESARDIGSIFKIDPNAIEKWSAQCENFLISDQRWRSVLSRTTFEELYEEVDQIKALFQVLRFMDVRTIQRLKSLDLLDPNYSLIPPNFDGKSAVFDEKFWEKIQNQLVEKKYQKLNTSYILHFFQEVDWPFERDLCMERRLQKIVKSAIPERLTLIKAGSHLIDKGEKITKKHIAMIQTMNKVIVETQKGSQFLFFIAKFISGGIIVCIAFVYLKINHKDLVNDPYKFILYVTIMILTFVLSKIVEFFLLQNVTDFLKISHYPIIVPFASILFRILFNNGVAVFSTYFLSVFLGFCLTIDPARFIPINLITSAIAILASNHLRKRKQVFIVCAKVWLICIPVFFVYNFFDGFIFNAFIFSNLIGAFIFLFITALLIISLVPILESFFRIMTEMTLVEYMDPSNELLHRLSVEAPGTYQHSLVVGSISEAAAQAIGANGLFCRVATLYHDIGKLFNPHYFTENQMGNFNIHQLLTPQESAQVIIAHVTEGEILARKHSLPSHFIDIIRQHHGTTLVYYFFCKEVEQEGGNAEAVDQSLFRYPGPKPRTKESAIIMMADTVEAASRSLEEVNEETITELVNRLIQEKVEDGQFDECQLTFEEFEIVKQKMIKSLSVARHLRIKYPS